jgi:hypothetical protein
MVLYGLQGKNMNLAKNPLLWGEARRQFKNNFTPEEEELKNQGCAFILLG